MYLNLILKCAERVVFHPGKWIKAFVLLVKMCKGWQNESFVPVASKTYEIRSEECKRETGCFGLMFCIYL